MVGVARSLYGLSILAAAAVAKVTIGEGRAWTAEEYASGEVHQASMELKMKNWADAEAAGLMDSTRYPELGFTRCNNGFAEAIAGDRNNTFRCQNFDLMHFRNHASLGEARAAPAGSSSWGWTSSTGREFVAIGQFTGTAFVEITTDGRMNYLGRLPAYDPIGSQWREIRTIGDYIVVGSEAVNHGIQVFDMKKLLTLSPSSPRTFTQQDLTSWTRQLLPVGRAHNVVVNPELEYFVAVGAQPRNDPLCRSGLNFFDFSDPANPVSLGCAADDGYVHDAECLVYRGPDARYQGRDICYGYNEDTVTIYDVTNKANVTNIISRITYPGARYIHQGAVLDVNNQEYLVLDDELDERDNRGVGVAANGFATTYIVDIRNLEQPRVTGNYQTRHRAIDHNQYIWRGQNYQSSYGAGLRVFDVSSIPSDPTGASVCESGFFDIYPEDDFAPGGGVIQFLGSWSSYADFASGYTFINTIERGAFIVRQTSRTCRPEPVCNADNCLRALRANTVAGRLEESQNMCRTFTNIPAAATSTLPRYARDGCTGNTGARVSSACACLPTPTGNFA